MWAWVSFVLPLLGLRLEGLRGPRPGAARRQLGDSDIPLPTLLC